jgi:hypothetical protein
VALSVGVAVTSSLQTNVMERLAWLEVVLQTVDLRVCARPSRSLRGTNFLQDTDIQEVAPKIMDILIARLNELYMSVAKDSPHSPILRRIPALARRATELRGN